jgi:hypothetical protein
MENLLNRLKITSLCESDAFAAWMGLEPHSKNPWSLSGNDEVTLAMSKLFSRETKDMKKKGNALHGFTFDQIEK